VHETGLALEIYRAARQAAGSEGGFPLAKVSVAIGELSAVEPSLLEFAWQAVVAGGKDAAAQLEVEWCPVTRYCPRCGEGKGSSLGSWLPLCPDCGDPMLVKGGEELDLLRVTIEMPDGVPT